MPYFSKNITRNAIITYLLALMACSVLYIKYALMWYWMAFGLVEVVGFFYFSNVISKDWERLNDKGFSSKLFKVSLVIRVIYVFFSYWFYYEMTDGGHFEIGAADTLFYHEVAKHTAELMRNGDWQLLQNTMEYGNSALSDTGYAMYLSIVYYLSNDSILFVRILKAIWSSWTVVLIYKLAKRNFGENVARVSAVMCMLMPNLIYYCGIHLKEVEMVFLEVLFVERVDYIIRGSKLKVIQILAIMLIPITLFTIRTALAAVLILSFCVSLLLSKNRIMSRRKRIVLIVGMTLFVGMLFFNNTGFGRDVVDMWNSKDKQQESNMEWRSRRKNGNEFAKYVGAAVFAPMIFTIPFPTMVEIDGQKNQRMIHGGNFDKNITSFFTILSLFILLLSGDWRKHVLPISVLCGYLVVLAFSSFPHSERFHLPTIPLALMFSAYGISMLRTKQKYQRWFGYWCVVMFVAAVAWNWFKLSGRGMI